MDKIEISINGLKVLELDQIDINTIKEIEAIPDENFKNCVKNWATMIFLHRLRKARDKIIFEANHSSGGLTEDDPVIPSLYERHGIKEIPTNQRKQIELILSLYAKEKENASTSLYT